MDGRIKFTIYFIKSTALFPNSRFPAVYVSRTEFMRMRGIWSEPKIR